MQRGVGSVRLLVDSVIPFDVLRLGLRRRRAASYEASFERAREGIFEDEQFPGFGRTDPNPRMVVARHTVRAPCRTHASEFAQGTISRDAKLFFNPQSGVLPCGVRNITNRGASLRVADLTVLPVNFELSFDNFHTKRDCRLVWRDGNFLGVAFQN